MSNLPRSYKPWAYRIFADQALCLSADKYFIRRIDNNYSRIILFG